jgi:hypothetical protein
VYHHLAFRTFLITAGLFLTNIHLPYDGRPFWPTIHPEKEKI